MKKLFTLTVVAIITLSVFAQVPQKLSYQAVIRNASGELVANQTVGIKFSILEGSVSGTPVYAETHITTTNTNGLVSVDIGGGTIISGSFAAINWADGTFFLRTETDLSGGANYTISGTSKFLSVPYSLHSGQAESATESDPTWAGLANETGNIGRAGQVGIGLTAPDALLHTDGRGTGQGNVLFVGAYKLPNPGNAPASGPGTRMMWYPDKAAFRAGFVEGTQWNTANIGDHSVSMGFNTIASGPRSFSIGENTTASGHNSSALGEGTIASSFCVTAIGSYNSGGGLANNWQATDPLFEIGNGTSSSARNNAFTVLKNGNVGIRANRPSSGLYLKGTGWPSSFIIIESDDGEDAGIRLNEGTTAKWSLFCDGGTDGLQIYNNGGVTAIFCKQVSPCYVGIGTRQPTCQLQVGSTGDGSQARANAWNLLSDIRLKKDLSDLSDPLGMISKIKGFYFYWNTGTDQSRQVGFSAQDVRKVLPEVVSSASDGYMAIEYGKMAPLFVEAIKALKAENEDLKARLERLEAKVGR